MASWPRVILLLALLALAAAQLSCGGSHRRLGALGQLPLQIQQSQQQPRPQTLGEALAQLDDMQVLHGVKPEVFAQLKDALRSALTTNNQKPTTKLVSTPPTGAKNAVPDLAFVDNGDGTISLTWSYYNLADYDQDGIVGVGDIIPLAQHFGEAVPPEDVNSLLALIDGSGNDVIDVPDVTPIAANFGIEVAKYDIQASPSQAGPFTSAQQVAVGTGLDSATQRMHFAVVIEPTPQYWYRVVPLDAEGVAGEPGSILHAPSVLPSLAAPTSLAAVAVSAHEIALSWQDNSTYESGFRIERKQGVFGAWGVVGTADANSTGFIDNSAFSSTTHFYRIQAFNDLGSSAYSNEASATTTVDYSSWAHTWGGNDLDSASDVAVDSSGNVYVVGASSIKGVFWEQGTAAFLIKYSSGGSLLWKKTLGCHSASSANGIFIDENDNIYVTGSATSPTPPGTFVFLYKYSSDGKAIWQKAWDDGGWIESSRLSVSRDGSIYLAAQDGNLDIILLKYLADGTLAWQKKRSSSPLWQYAFSIDTDVNGDVLIGGGLQNSDTDTCSGLLIKYSSDGDLLWEKTWTIHPYDFLTSVCSDGDGEIYVAGVSRGDPWDGSTEDAVLLKYSSDGSLLWQKTWFSESRERAHAVSVDADGNVYTAGYGPGDGASLLKFTPEGDLLWQKIWGEAIYNNPNVTAICLDNNGFAYLAGFARDATGIWSDGSAGINQINGIEGIPDKVEEPVSGQDNEVTISLPPPEGVEDIGGGSADALVIKVDTSAWEWSPLAPRNLTATTISIARINLAWEDTAYENGYRIERRIGVDGDWALLWTAGANETSYSDTDLLPFQTYYYRVQAFNDLGSSLYSNEAWTSTYSPSLQAPTNVQATAVSLSEIKLTWTDNSVYESGFYIERREGWSGSWSVIFTASANSSSYNDKGVNSSSTFYYRVQAYNDMGTSPYSYEAYASTLNAISLWAHTLYDGSANANCVDGSGDAYVVGTCSRLSDHNDVLILKYAPDGTLLWGKTWGTNDQDIACGVGTDVFGNVYVTGYILSYANKNSEALLLKYSADGTLLWQKTWGGSKYDYATSLAVNSSGDVYVAGYTDSFGVGYSDTFLLKYTSDGTIIWQDTWGSRFSDYAYAISLDDSGYVYIAGKSGVIGINKSDALLLKYAPDGALLWQKKWGSAEDDSANSIDVDGSGNVYLSGSTNGFGFGNPVDSDAFILICSSDGVPLVQSTWGYNDSAEDAKAIRAGATGNVYVAGKQDSSIAFLLKYSFDGNLVWQTGLNGSAYALALDDSGLIYLAGSAHGSWLYWDSLAGSISYPSSVLSDVEGSLLSVNGIENTPAGTEGIPTGAEDISSALIMKLTLFEF